MYGFLVFTLIFKYELSLYQYNSCSQDQFYGYEIEDSWLQEVVKVVEEIVVPLKPLLHQNIYDSVLKISITEVYRDFTLEITDIF